MCKTFDIDGPSYSLLSQVYYVRACHAIMSRKRTRRRNLNQVCKLSGSCRYLDIKCHAFLLTDNKEHQVRMDALLFSRLHNLQNRSILSRSEAAAWTHYRFPPYCYRYFYTQRVRLIPLYVYACLFAGVKKVHNVLWMAAWPQLSSGVW